ncbi:MAG: hypothetical protein KAR42_12900 [candidate division Zixibacteria bacterium]|nr:hypothetical protein [candidate division Zixibacteria bacterium]
MKINTTPVEAYRQSGNQTLRKSPGAQPELDLNKAADKDKITIPGSGDNNVGSVHVAKSPSILSSVLSSDEKQMLTKHFARYGDAPESTRVYGTDARTHASGMTGMKVDLTG